MMALRCRLKWWTDRFSSMAFSRVSYRSHRNAMNRWFVRGTIERQKVDGLGCDGFTSKLRMTQSGYKMDVGSKMRLRAGDESLAHP